MSPLSAHFPPSLRRLLSRSLYAAAAVLIFTVPARAGVGVWTPATPEGGSVNVLAISPSDPRIVFAGTRSGGAFKSADGGRSWSAASTGLVDAGAFPPIASLEIDPRRPNVVYAGTYFHGAYRSSDGGGSWTRCGGLPPIGLTAKVSSLRVDPAVSSTVYAGTPHGVLRSRDGGATWALRRAGLPASEVLALAFDPAGRYLYAGLQEGGVYRSVDQGGRWERANAGLPSSVESLGFDPRSPSIVFAGTSMGLYRSVDRGRRWTRVGTELVVRNVLGVGFQGSSDLAFAGTRTAGVFVSSDRGVTWRPVAGAVPVPQLLLSFAIGPETLLAGSFEDRRGGGIARSVDGGATWRVSNRGFSNLHVLELAFNPSDPAILYASTGAVGLFKSTNGGGSWRHVPLAPADPAISAEGLAVEPTAPDTVYLGASSQLGLLRSDDAGATWRNAGPDGGTAMSVVRPDPRTLGGLWTGGFGTSFHTADGGATWEHVVPPEGVFPWFYDIEVDPTDPNVVTYAGSRLLNNRPPQQNPLLLRTEDGGATWVRLATATLPGSAVISYSTDRRSPGTHYAVTFTGIYRTENEGATWKEILAFALQTGDLVATPGAIYASRGATVLRSTDRGETWAPIRNGLGARPVERLWVDPRDPKHLFAGTFSAGLYEYTLPATP